MDFLDPRKTKTHRRRLMFGYVLFAVAIMLGTVILVYGAYGYSLNTKTGDVIENGLLFVDSQPSGAHISLNNKDIGETTSARKVLQAGSYSLKLSKDGYRDWSRNFILEEHSVARYVYPLLFPKKPVSVTLKKYTTQPGLITTSPDRNWLLVFGAETSVEVIDQFDTQNPTSPPKTLALPAGLLSPSTSPASYKLVEWSTDNKHVLVQRSYSGGSEFIMIDRDSPTNSYNVNKLFGITPDKVALRDKKYDQLYIYSADGLLRQADIANPSQTSLLLKDVLEFKPYGSDLIVYVTKSTTNPQMAQVMIWEDTKTYNLYKVALGDKYLVDLAKFQGHFYYVAGSSSGNIYLFKDPLDSLKDSKSTKALPFITLRLSGAQTAAFSANARFIEAEAGQSFAVYDLEEEQYYKYLISAKLSGLATWMDGHRLIGTASGSVFVMDYDKTNQQSLFSTVWPEGALFDQKYENMFTLSAANAGGYNLVDVDMRAGTDLPSARR